RTSPPPLTPAVSANAFPWRKFAPASAGRGLRARAACGNLRAGEARWKLTGCCGTLYASFHHRNVHRVRSLRDQVSHAHDYGRQEREVRHSPRPVHRLLGLRPVLPGFLHPGPEGRARREGQAEGDSQGHRGPGSLHRLRVLHRHLPLRLHLPDRRPPPRDLPQDRGGRCRSLRLLPALRDRLREGRNLRPEPDYAGEAVPPGPVTEPPRDAPPPGDEEDDESTGEPRGAGRLIARFFLLPLLVVGAAVGVFLVFNLMTFERRSPRDYLQEVRGGTANRRWQAAFELSRSLPNLPPEERAALTAETLRIFEGLSGKRPEDIPVRRYLVLVLGRLGESSALPALEAA